MYTQILVYEDTLTKGISKDVMWKILWYYCIKVNPVFHDLNQKWKNEARVIDVFSGIVAEKNSWHFISFLVPKIVCFQSLKAYFSF